MKIAVCSKQIPDPANEVTYENGLLKRPDEQVLDDTDRYGIELALQLKEKYDAEVTIISMGPKGTLKGVQQALQMGADKALVISDESLSGANALITANVISEVAKLSEADLIIFGTESTDGYSGTVPQQVSRYLNLDCISYVKAVEINSEKVTLTRQTLEGSEKVDMPNKDIMAAKSKPIEEVNINDLNITAQQNLKFLEIEEVENSKNGQKIIDEGEAYNSIIEKLKELKII